MLRIFALCLLVFLLNGCYILDQAKGHLGVMWNSEPLEQAIKNEPNEKYSAMLAEVPKIIAFGENILQLKKSDNYQSYYRTNKKGMTFVVTASDKLQLKAYVWWYPIVGSLPFHGYYEEEDATEYAAEMEQDGYDTYIFPSIAYSTLGWFSDPITSPMLSRGRAQLVDTVLHEMTHATYFFKDHGDYNESLATFVGIKGAELYLKANGGISKVDPTADALAKEKRKRFLDTVNDTKNRLTLLFAEDIPDDEKLIRKQELYSELAAKVGEIYPNSSANYRSFNNARILQYGRYQESEKLNPFSAIYDEVGQDWVKFWERVRQDEKTIAETHFSGKE